MAYPLSVPEVTLVDRFCTSGATTVRQLCAAAGVSCPVLPGADRPVVLTPIAAGTQSWVRAEGLARKPSGPVEIGVPPLDGAEITHARWALCTLAFTTMFDAAA
jgi:hypothetical protein